MREAIFWDLLAQICDMGEFVVTTYSGTAAADIAGRLRVGTAGGETVLENPGCGCHVHIYFYDEPRVSFTYRDVGNGPEPCVDIHAGESGGEEALWLRYLGNDAATKHAAFTKRNAANAAMWSGSW